MDLLNWRKEKGLSRLKFSKLSGIPISTIVKHEDGKKTRKETLDKIEKACQRYERYGSLEEIDICKPDSLHVCELWKYLSPKYCFIAKDFSEDVYCFTDEPKVDLSSRSWVSDSESLKLPLSTEFDADDWKETLCKRPVDYRSYIGRFGLFYDSNEDCSYFGMLTSIQNGFQRNNGFCYKNFRLLTDEEKERL